MNMIIERIDINVSPKNIIYGVKKIILQKNCLKYEKMLLKCTFESRFFNNNFIINIIIILITYTNISINYYTH